MIGSGIKNVPIIIPAKPAKIDESLAPPHFAPKAPQRKSVTIIIKASIARIPSSYGSIRVNLSSIPNTEATARRYIIPGIPGMKDTNIPGIKRIPNITINSMSVMNDILTQNKNPD
jgi:hypothetical protein